MRIVYLHQYFVTPQMAGGSRSYELARRLVAAGHEVHMVTSDRQASPNGAKWRRSVEAGIHVHWVSIPYDNDMGHRQRISAFLKFAFAAAAKAAELRGDVVYATSTPLTIALPAVYAARRGNVPMVFEVRDLWPDVPVAIGALRHRPLIAAARALERCAYRFSRRVVALTPTMRDFISGKGVPLEKIAVIPNGADLSRFDPAASADVSGEASSRGSLGAPHTLLYCGSLGPAHGPEYLVRLAAALADAEAEVQIVVVGAGRLRERLQAQAAAAGCLGRTIRFVGEVPAADVPTWYAQADASIMTMADCELLCRHSVQNKFFDSLAAAKPVFANYAGWSSELAVQEGAGCVLPRDDFRAAAAAVAEKLHDEAWLHGARRAARRLAEESFSYDLLAGRLADVLEEAGLRGASTPGAPSGATPRQMNASPGELPHRE